MAIYNFTAVDTGGRKRKGLLEADNDAQLRHRLRAQGWMPLTVKASGHNQQGLFHRRIMGRPFSLRQLSYITRQLATLLESGIPLEKAVDMAAKHHHKEHVKNVMLSLRAKVMEGHTFSYALGEFPDYFSGLFRATVAAGEKAGSLDFTLAQLADYYETHAQNLEKVLLTLLYPVILVVTSIIITVFLLTYVFPEIAGVFVKVNQALPLLTRMLLVISGAAKHYILVVALVLLCLTAVVRRRLQQERYLLALHKKMMSWPVIAPFITALNMARFSGTLSMLVRSGVPLVDALRVTAQVIPNRYLRQSVGTVAAKVQSGSSLYGAMEAESHFPPMLVHMVASGEASGQLENMLERVAQAQARELRNRTALFVGILEPAVILVMGGIVLVTVLAILLPIMELNQLVQK